MANGRKSSSSDQGDLFQQLEQPALSAAEANAPDLDINPELLGAINTAIREAKKRGLSRERLVERMNLALPDGGKPITLRQLNAWTAQSKEYHEFPARYLPAFCWATGCHLPLQVLAHPLGLEAVDRRDQAALALGQKLVAKAQLSREVRELQQLLDR